jgi:hypothetical protein
MTIKTGGGGRFVERPELSPERAGVVFEKEHNERQKGLGSFSRTSITTAKTGRGRFVERAERPPKRAGVVFENGHHDRRNGAGPFCRTPMTDSGRAF